MDKDMRERAARQGLGRVVAHVRCPECNYVAETAEKQQVLIKPGAPCPKCGTIGRTAYIAPNRYLDVVSWIGEYAVTDNPRDHVSAVILFCALTESILETLNDDYLGLHPEVRSKFKPGARPNFKNVFGKTLCDLLSSAPDPLKDFPAAWERLRGKRNEFLHGKSSSYLINKTDADEAMDLAVQAVKVYVWVNNEYCLNI